MGQSLLTWTLYSSLHLNWDQVLAPCEEEKTCPSWCDQVHPNVHIQSKSDNSCSGSVFLLTDGLCQQPRRTRSDFSVCTSDDWTWKWFIPFFSSSLKKSSSVKIQTFFFTIVLQSTHIWSSQVVPPKELWFYFLFWSCLFCLHSSWENKNCNSKENKNCNFKEMQQKH